MTRFDGHALLYLPWKFDLLGGVDVVVSRLWEGMEKLSPGSASIGIQDWETDGLAFHAEGRRFLHLNLPAPNVSGKSSRLKYGMTLARRLPALASCLAANRITLLNAHFPTLNLFPLTILKRLGIWRGKLVLSFHGSDVSAIDPKSTLWQQVAEATDSVTACSKELAARVTALELFKQPVTVIHNGIDGPAFLARAPEPNFRVDGPYVLNVGNFIPSKGQDLLLRAFSRVCAEHPDVKLICAGGTDNGAWLGKLRQLADELELSSRVLFLENQSQGNVACLMRGALCMVHTPRFEAFGVVLTEAAVCETPIIATAVGGIPEIVPSQEFGILTQPGDEDGLCEAMKRTIKGDPDARARAESLSHRVDQSFSVEAMVDKYVSAFSNAITRN